MAACGTMPTPPSDTTSAHEDHRPDVHMAPFDENGLDTSTSPTVPPPATSTTVGPLGPLGPPAPAATLTGPVVQLDVSLSLSTGPGQCRSWDSLDSRSPSARPF